MLNGNLKKLCVLGSTQSSIELIYFLKDKKINVHTLITIDEIKSKKNNVAGYDILALERLKKIGVKVFKVSRFDLKSAADFSFFKKNKFDLCLCTGWQRKIPLDIQREVKYGIFGWHGSYLKLPNGVGRSPMNWSLRLNKNSIYHTCFKYNDEFDKGDIFEIKEFYIAKNDYIIDLQKKANKHICVSSYKLIKVINNEKKILKLKKQRGRTNKVFTKITDDICRIDPNKLNFLDAYNLIRASSHPFSGAYYRYNNDKVIRIYKAKIIKNPTGEIENIANGTLFIRDKCLFLKFAQKSLRLDEYLFTRNRF